MNTLTDVLVVGAGPTGLTAALELQRRGINVRLIERLTEPSDKSKALVIHARTLELLDLVNLADELVSKGYTSPGIDFSASVAKPLRADMHRLASETRFPFILILPQAETEAALERSFIRHGGTVERGIELKNFQQSDSEVIATLTHHDGSEETVNSRYLIGSDGPHSTTRKILGLGFEGSHYSWTAFLGDVRMTGHASEGGTEQHANSRGLAFIVPFEDGSHRIVTIGSRYQGAEERHDLTLEELQKSVSSILEKPIELSQPNWLTRWGAELRIVEAYGRGRVFLAGDAAHTHSPAGGQGMNTGIQDAFDLGWRMALVLRGQAGTFLLEAYCEERRAIGERVLRVSDLLLRSLLLRKPVPRKLREILFHLLVPIPAVQRRLAMNLSGLAVRYGKSAQQGMRVPDLLLMNGSHQPIRLYELLRTGSPLALFFLDPRAEEHREAVQQSINAAQNVGEAAFVVLQNGMPEKHQFANAETLVDYRGEFEFRLGIAKTPHILVVRPDGYVAWSAATSDVRELQQKNQRWLRGTPSTSKADNKPHRWAIAAGLFLASAALAWRLRRAA